MVFSKRFVESRLKITEIFIYSDCKLPHDYFMVMKTGELAGVMADLKNLFEKPFKDKSIYLTNKNLT